MNQNGLLAQKGAEVVMHNTLAASDYALIDQDTLAPRPNYWAAVLWQRTMGTTVLASPASPSAELRLYAHCLPSRKGGVGVMALNIGRAAQTLRPGRGAKAWLMAGTPLDSREITINGRTPKLNAKGGLDGLTAMPVKAALTLPGQTIAFVAVPGANNPACR